MGLDGFRTGGIITASSGQVRYRCVCQPAVVMVLLSGGFAEEEEEGVGEQRLV